MRRLATLLLVFALGAGSGAGGTLLVQRRSDPAAGLRGRLASLPDSAPRDSAAAKPAAPVETTPAAGLSAFAAVSAADTAPALAPADTVPAALDSLAGVVPALAGTRPLTAQRVARVFAAMQARDAAAVLGRLGDPQVQTVLGLMGDRQTAAILTALGPDRAAALTGAAIQQSRIPR